MFDGDKKENEEEAIMYKCMIYYIHVKMLAIYQTY